MKGKKNSTSKNKKEKTEKSENSPKKNNTSPNKEEKQKNTKKSKNENDLNQYSSIIRINCIENIPSSIENIFTLSNINLLCLCRSDNSIEIWTTNSWIQLIKFPGLKNIQTRRVWLISKNNNKNSNTNNILNSLRLFSIGLNGYFIEWSFETLLPKFTYKNPGGAIWDFQIKNKVCLLSSNDGSIRIIQIKKNEAPYLIKQYEKTQSKILSICFENSSNSIFYTGNSNGAILKWNLHNGQVMSTVNTEKNILIWAICSIDNKFLACGDSTGRLIICDMSLGVIIQEFKEHIGAILTICFNNNSNDNKTIYYSGMDSLVCCIKYNIKNNEWILASTFRGQSHDINSLALLGVNTLLSGGNTTDICIYHLFTGGNLYQKYDKKVNTNIKRHISPFEHKNNYHLSNVINDMFFIIHQKLDYVDLWNINLQNKTNTFLAKIYKSKGVESNIISSNISSDGKIICLSYDKIIVVFKYDFENNEIKKIGTIPHQANFIFINKNQILFLSQIDNKFYIYENNNEKKFNEKFSIILPINNDINILNNNKNSNNNKQLLLASEYIPEKNMVIYSTLNRQLYLIDISSNTIESLPHPDSYITKIKTSIDKNNIITIDENNLIYIINLKTKKFNEWTNQRILHEDYPLNYLKWYNKIFGICPLNTNKFILFTDYNYITVDLNKEIPQQCIIDKNKMDKYIYSEWDKIVKEYHQKIFEEEYKPSNPLAKENKNIFMPTEIKDKLGLSLQNTNFKITSRFNSIMLMQKIIYEKEDEDKNYIIVIENDWNDIVKSFPGAIVKHNYGH